MPIVINATDSVATVTEADGLLSRMMDGVSGVIAGDNLTASEARMAAVAFTIAGVAGGSVWTRKRTNYNGAVKPMLGFFG